MEHWMEELKALSGPRRAAMEFLRESLPHSDLDTYPFDLFLAFADHALMLRTSAPWCAALEEDMFRHYVLCPRVNDEDLSTHRVRFYVELWGRVKDLSAEDAALAVNRWCHEKATYGAQDDRTASPLTVYRGGVGRCGEESAFLVAALRSVGLAARQVYAPRWSHCDDNHAWVEVLCGGVWRFMGACEPEPILDRGWFNTAASRAVLVRSRTFGQGTGPLHGDLLGNSGGVACYNQTARYARTAQRVFRVMENGSPAAGAQVELQILNEASLHTIAVLTTGADGLASADLGLGTVWVAAIHGPLRAEGVSSGPELVLELTAAPVGEAWQEFDFHAPQDHPVNPAPLSGEQKARRAAGRMAGDLIRAARAANWYDAARAARFPRCDDLLRAARGNFDEIYAFLCEDEDPLREELLRTLRPKDLRDVTAETLEDHLQGAAPYAARFPREVFDAYVLCPRIADEALTPWRSLMGRMEDITPDFENGANLYWPPAQAEAAGRCDEKSLAVLFVAWFRSRGVPARLREIDGAPEVWDSWAFRTVEPEKCAPLTLVKAAGTTPAYRVTWTLSRRTGDGWRLLRLTDDDWDGDEYHIRLPLGTYRLISSVRLPSGDQLAALRSFNLADGGMVRMDLRQRTYALADMLYRRALPPVPAAGLDGAGLENALVPAGRPALLLWLEEGAEPTEHVLNELAEAREKLRALPVDIKFFLRSASARAQPTLARLLASWPEVQVLLGDWAYDLETLSRHLGCDPDRPPLAVVQSRAGEAVYAESGYRVGSVALLTSILSLISGD